METAQPAKFEDAIREALDIEPVRRRNLPTWKLSRRKNM